MLRPVGAVFRCESSGRGHRSGSGCLRVRVLWPEDEGTASEDPNQNAVVLLASYGETDVFLSADAESDVTARLSLRPVEVMKVAHHGSEDAGLAAELETLRPRIAVISCGRNNDYGHPRPETLAALGAAPGLAVYRTDEDGRVVVESDGHAPDRAKRPLASVSAWPKRPRSRSTSSPGATARRSRPRSRRLKSHFAAEAIETASALDTTGDDAVALCNAGSLFGDARLIVVADVDGAKQAEGRRKGGWKAADVEAIAAYLASPAPDTVLALVAEDLKSSSALWKACAKAGDVLEYEVEKKKLHEWVDSAVRADSRRAPSPMPCSALIQLVGEDPACAEVRDRQAVDLGRGRAVRRARGRGARRVERRRSDLRADRGLGGSRRVTRARRERDDLRARVATAPRHRGAARRLAGRVTSAGSARSSGSPPKA